MTGRAHRTRRSGPRLASTLVTSGHTADPAHGRHRVRRWPAAPRARGARRTRPLPLAPARVPAATGCADDRGRQATCSSRRRSRSALVGVDTVYYLVHSMSSSPAVRRRRPRGGARVRRGGARGRSAEGRVPRRPRARRSSPRISRRGRRSVRSCAASGVPTIEFRASIVIGSGSASFEMIRALVEKLPVMVTPRWVRVRAQPIAIEDVLAYLLEALDREPEGGELFEIGGSDRVTYLDLMQEYAAPARPPPDDDPGAGAHAAPVEPVALARDAGATRASAESSWTPEERDGRRGRSRRSRCSGCARVASTTRSPARSRSRTGRSRRRAGRTRRSPRRPPSEACATGHDSSTPGRPPCRCRAAQAFAPIQAIGGETGWYKGAALWRLRGLLDVSSVARASAGAGAIPSASRSATRSTSGASRRSSAIAAPAQGGDEGAGTGVAAVRGLGRSRADAARPSPRPPSSILPGSSVSSTGTGSGLSTATSSAACCGTSSRRLRRRR